MIILGLLLFTLLVVVHEYGHFLMARRNGVEVEEFGIGFPPRLYGRKFGKSKTLYSFNLIPLGGFVKLKGETDSDRRTGSFGATSFKNKAKILLAGVGMNIVAVYVIILFLALTSLPVIIPQQFNVASDQKTVRSHVAVAGVEPDSAAAKLGLETGDAVLEINGQKAQNAESLRQLTSRFKGQTVPITYLKNGEQRQAEIALGESDEKGILGVAPIDVETRRYTWAAPIVAAGITFQMISLTILGILALIVGLFSGGGEAVEQVTGPIGIFFLLNNIGNFGINFMLVLIAIISASLAVFNALPIPALDGGRLFVIGLARLFKKPLTAKVENAVHTAGFALLMLLIVAISYRDVTRLF
jgi:regulator of sigma E protease